MKTIEIQLKDEKEMLEKVIEKVKGRSKNVPKGHIRFVKKKNHVECYYKDEKEKGNGRYLKKEERDLVKRIVQKDYDNCMIRRAKERIKAIDTFLDIYHKTSLKKLYQRINPYRRELIDSPVISDEEYIKQWEQVRYEGNPYNWNENEIITEKGERVRSKSEKIIADKLLALGIPYRYECPLVLKENIMYPDFTILKMPERKVVYLEHFGMMGDIDYVERMLYKLDVYEKNEIFLGVNLFMTYETERKVLNTKALDSLLKQIFL